MACRANASTEILVIKLSICTNLAGKVVPVLVLGALAGGCLRVPDSTSLTVLILDALEAVPDQTSLTDTLESRLVVESVS